MKCHVGQLESYLGGELPEEGSGVTWRDERSALLAKINVRENMHVQCTYSVYMCIYMYMYIQLHIHVHVR